MNRFKIYYSFSLDELLNDESFIILVNKHFTDPSLKKEWESFISAHVEVEENFREAANIIHISAGAPVHVSSESKDRVWKEITGKINKPVMKTSYKWWRIAAIIIVMISIAGINLWNTKESPSIVKWKTSSGQSKVIILPDASVVTLKENSMISYKENWTTDDVREVWIDGQAHFDVSHLNEDTLLIRNNEKFIVHLENDMNITVLGTVFSVKSAIKGSSVELESGSVKVGFTERDIQKSVLLKPGEKFEFKGETKLFVKMKAAGNSLSDNESGKALELKNTSVKEIIAMVESAYNKRIRVSDSTILSRKLDGSFPIHSENDVWFVLSNILDIDVVIVNDDVLELRPRD